MSKLNYVNLGCGNHAHPAWINIDFHSGSDQVIAHNLLFGIPLESNSMDVVYHSHVLEHFPKDKAGDFISDCYRVLKPGGIIRIAVPDLGGIIHHYVRITRQLDINPDDGDLWAQYDWIMMELYDQTVREASGGSMGKFLTSGKVTNQKFVVERCGDEVKNIMNSPRTYSSFNTEAVKPKVSLVTELYRILRYRGRKERICRLLQSEEKSRMLSIGRFRLGGEIHQWMYDRHSVRRLLNENGFRSFEIKSAFESNIERWSEFQLDGKNGVVRKPDSLFVEAKKPR